MNSKKRKKEVEIPVVKEELILGLFKWIMMGIKSPWRLDSTGYSENNDVTVLFKDASIYNKLEITSFATPKLWWQTSAINSWCDGVNSLSKLFQGLIEQKDLKGTSGARTFVPAQSRSWSILREAGRLDSLCRIYLIFYMLVWKKVQQVKQMVTHLWANILSTLALSNIHPLSTFPYTSKKIHSLKKPSLGASWVPGTVPGPGSAGWLKHFSALKKEQGRFTSRHMFPMQSVKFSARVRSWI